MAVAQKSRRSNSQDPANHAARRLPQIELSSGVANAAVDRNTSTSNPRKASAIIAMMRTMVMRCNSCLGIAGHDFCGGNVVAPSRADVAGTWTGPVRSIAVSDGDCVASAIAANGLGVPPIPH